MKQSCEEMPAAAQFRVEMKITSARELQNVNWRGDGRLRPYAAVWVEKESKQQTYVAARGSGSSSYSWANQTLFIPCSTCTEETILHVQILHQSDTYDDKDTKPNVGRKQINLFELVNDSDLIRRWGNRTYYLERKNGRPQGVVDIRLRIMPLRPNEEADVEEREYLGPEAM